MESLGDILKDKLTKKARKTNKFWLIAEEIAAATNTKPIRWLREVKSNEFAVQRALIDLKELQARNPAALFTWLLKKYKQKYWQRIYLYVIMFSSSGLEHDSNSEPSTFTVRR